MANDITQSFVQQYSDNVIHLSQQKGSRLMGTVRMKPDVVGQNQYFERLGATAAVQRTVRHGDTPLIEVPHSRRQLTMLDYEWASLIDSQDKLRTLINPESEYVIAATNAFGRIKDDIIIAAAVGSSQSGQDGATAVTFPSTQTLGSSYNTSNDSGHMSIPKLLAIKKIMDLADVDPDEPRWAVVSPYQIQDLLNTTQVTSADYNTVKALAEGAIDTFLGFKFIMTNRLLTWGASQTGFFGSTTSASGDYRCLFYTTAGIGLGVAEDVTTRITERGDKGYAVQVYMRMTMGATRIEEVKVVEADATGS